MSHRGVVKDSETVLGETYGITLTATPQLVVPAGKRRSATMTNNGGVTAFYGHDILVTAAAGSHAGQPSPADVTAPFFDDETDAAWYGVVASGTCDVRVQRTF